MKTGPCLTPATPYPAKFRVLFFNNGQRRRRRKHLFVDPVARPDWTGWDSDPAVLCGGTSVVCHLVGAGCPRGTVFLLRKT